jgi:hypothetical protein
MPNHVTNIISFKGSAKDVEDLRNAIKSIDSDGEEQAIDFSKIIPMPPELMITSGSNVDYGIAVILFRERGDDSKLKPILAYPWVKAENITNAEQLANYLVEEGRADLIQGKQAVENSDKHGFKDWYSWSIANWGTKWNAYGISEVDENTICFDTAWSTPAPVIEELSSMFPNVEITLEFADEDFGHNCGKVVFLDGDTIDENIPKGGSAEAYVLAAKINNMGLEHIFYNIGYSEDETFLNEVFIAMFSKFSPKEVIDEVEFSDDIEFSDTFFSVLKQTLIDQEEYELIGLLDKIKDSVKKEGEE